MTARYINLHFTYFYLLERCCIHNAPPVVTNSCLPPSRCKANVLLAKVCLHCTKPGGGALNLQVIDFGSKGG